MIRFSLSMAAVIAMIFVSTPRSIFAEDVEVCVTVSSEAVGQVAENLLDGKTDTSWQSEWWQRNYCNPPHEIEITLPEPREIASVTLVHNQRLGAGKAKEYALQIAGSATIRGTFTESGEQKIAFPEACSTNYLKLNIHSVHKELPWVSIAELRIDAPGVKLVPQPADENRLKTREAKRRYGICPPNKDSSIDVLQLVLRTYELLERDHGDVKRYKGRVEQVLDQYASKRNDSRWREEILKLRREMILSHPKLNFSKLLINKRRPPGFSHQCDQYLGRHSFEGVGLCVLEDWKNKPRCKVLLEGQLPKGDYRKPDLSYDGRKIAFAFCDHEARQGEALAFYLYECNADGSGLRQLTGTEDDDLAGWENRATVVTEDFDPCYLPNGDIVFVSTRSQSFGRCHGGRYVPTYLVYGMDRDGKNIHQISYGEANEWDPSVLPNGRVVYTRWDYINRHDVKFQSLWTMQPDGTGVAHYHGNYSTSPCMQAECRAIPGTNKTVFTGTAHHAYTAGTIFTCDPRKGEDGWEPLGRITPETQSPECDDPYGLNRDQSYCAPWPITENLYFVSRLPRRHSKQKHHDDDSDARWEIYLVDSIGGRELIYKDDTISCFSPIPLQSREVPRMIPSRIDPASKEKTGTFYVQNVYDCRQPIEEGTAKYLRINRIHGQITRNKPYLSTATNEILKEVVGYVPINGDGSVAFRAPAGAPLQLQVCDENKMAVMTMRSFVFLHKGEMASCTGCHEPRDSTPTTAMNYGRIRIQDPRQTSGPKYDGGFSFARTVQPVLDRYCIGCHGLKGNPPKDINLLGTRDRNASMSYASLTRDRDLVKVAYRNKETAYSKPKEYYAHAGRLASHLLTNEEHLKNIKLDRDSMTLIVEWLDLNGQYYGDYSMNRAERLGLDESAVNELREKVKQRFGSEIAQQPIAALINVAIPSESRLLKASLPKNRGGWGQFNNGFRDANDPEYKELVALVDKCITVPTHFDIRGTCGRLKGCKCGGCSSRRITEMIEYPAIDRQFRGDNGYHGPCDGSFELDQTRWRLVRVDSEETDIYDMRAVNAFDGDGSTWWCTQFHKASPAPPHELVIDLGVSEYISALRVLPRGGLGDIKEFEIYVSDNANDFGEPVDQIRLQSREGWRNVMKLQTLKKGRYFMLRTLSEWDDGLCSALRELKVYGLPKEIADPPEEKIAVDPVKHSDLTILRATYGAYDRMVDVTDKLRSLVDDSLEIKLGEYNDHFGDPYHGKSKKLTIEYEIDGQRRTASFVEDSEVVLR